MRHSFSAKIAIIILAIVLTTALGLTAAFSDKTTAAADGDVTPAEAISVLHITDVHYFPLDFACKLDSGYDSVSAFARVNAGASKLLLESTCVLQSTCAEILAMDADKIPEVMVVSGDLTSNGERQAMIDVANTLRQLQNDVRAKKGNDNFQIFVTPGNHDLYNAAACRYVADGSKEAVAFTSRKEFAFIFEGLGYKNYAEGDAIDQYKYWNYYNISDELAALLPYTAPGTAGSKTSYVRSLNSTQYNYHHMYEDWSSEDYECIIERIDEDDSDPADPNAMDYEDYDLGWLSYATKGKNGYSVFSIDVVLGTNEDGHVLGGRLQDCTKAWLDSADLAAVVESQNAAGNTLVATMHHNVLPHFDSEENYTTGFVLYGWEDAADYLSKYGIRYVFTGHEHANDVQPYMTYDNEVMYDFETASLISLGMNYRITDITRYSNKYEKVETALYPIQKVDLTLLYQHGYMDDNSIGKYADYVNEDHVITDVVGYMTAKVANDMISGVLDEYLSPAILNRLKTAAGDAVAKISNIETENAFLKSILESDYMSAINAANVRQLIDNLYKNINDVVLAGYTYNGDVDVYKAEDAKLFAYVNDLVYKLVDYQVATDNGQPKTIADLAIWSYSQYVLGSYYPTVADMPQWVQDGLAKLESGEAVAFVIDTLLDKNNGLYMLLEGLLNNTFDLSKGISASDVSSINGLLSMVSKSTKLESFNLGILLQEALPKVMDILSLDLGIDFASKPLTDIAQDLISKYYTESFKTGIGGLLGEVLVDFACDVTRDGYINEAGKKLNVTYLKNDEYAYYGAPRSDGDIAPTVENGKLPSMITVTFGDDPTTTKNFVYFTDKNCSTTKIQYCEGDKFVSAEAQTVTGAFKQMYYTDCIFNLGLWSSTTDKIIGRHEVSLSGLKPGTTYAYRLGDGNNYWSPEYTFTTAAESGSFNVLLIADMQNMMESAYDTVAEKIATIAKNVNYDFIINVGDFVDYGRNWDLWRYAFDKNVDVFANTTMVAATGNHDEKTFELDKDTVVQPGVATDNYNNMGIHFNFGNSVDQDTGVYYSFEYCGTLFVVLNTNDITDNKLADAQYNWCKNLLENTACAHKIIIMHKSLYSFGSHVNDPEIVGMRAQLTKLFADNKVDIVIAGHDHIYSESYYLDADGNKTTSLASDGNLSSDNGVLYVTIGTIGEKYYNTQPNDLPIAYGDKLHSPALSESTYAVLSFDGSTMKYVGYQISENQSIAALYDLTVEPAKSKQWIIWVVMGAFIVLMVLVSVIPQKRRQKKMNEMMAGLTVGTRIESIGGVIGTIVEISGDQVVINAGYNDRQLMTLEKKAIMKVVESNTDSDNADVATISDNDDAAPEVLEDTSIDLGEDVADNVTDDATNAEDDTTF